VALVFFAGAPLTAAGLAAVEFFGLNMSPRENLAGDGEAFVAVSAFLRPPFALGDVAGDAAVIAASPSAFLRPRLAFGEEAGASAGEADAVVSAVEAVV
jgi:hypothetical protein